MAAGEGSPGRFRGGTEGQRHFLEFHRNAVLLKAAR
jgi:hypothetical protein